MRGEFSSTCQSTIRDLLIGSRTPLYPMLHGGQNVQFAKFANLRNFEILVILDICDILRNVAPPTVDPTITHCCILGSSSF